MRIAALLLARDEEGIIRLSSWCAAQWCDELHLSLNNCTDRTEEYAVKPWRDLSKPVYLQRENTESWEWLEMPMRQRMLDSARRSGATHIAMVDADETPTANVLPLLRGWTEQLIPGQVLDVPMIPMRSLSEYQDDGSTWTKSWLSTAFMDEPSLFWKAASDGYQYHARTPKNSHFRRKTIYPQTKDRAAEGGIIHWQFANKRRLLAKHILYRCSEYLRWPGREPVSRLNELYDAALKCEKTTPAPAGWFSGYDLSMIDLDGPPWHEAELARILNPARRARMEADKLDLKGY